MSTTEKPSVSIFYPCYNDWGTMGSMVLFTLQTVEKLGIDFDFTIVDDGSAQQTLDLLDRIEQEYPAKVKVLRHETNKGYGGALRSGFASGTKEWIFYTDGDAQYDPRELKNLAALANDQIDFINGWKIERNDPLHRIIIGRLYQYIIKITFGLKLKDVDCDFRLMRRSVFDKVQLTADSGVICVELMKKVQDTGCRLTETPVHHYHRAYGQSQFFNFRRLAEVARDLGKLWLRLVVRKEHLQPATAETTAGLPPGTKSEAVADPGRANTIP